MKSVGLVIAANGRLREFRQPGVGILIFLFFVLPLVGVAPVAGVPIVVFQDDFDHDTVGAATTTDPPGDPAGDYLFFNGSGDSILVQSEVNDLTNQSLDLVSSGDPNFKLYATVDPEYRDCDNYTVRWRSLNHGNVVYVTVVARDTNLAVLGALEYRTMGVLSFNGSGNPLDTEWNVYIAQFFEMTLDMQAQTVNLSIDGVPDPEAQSLPFYQPGSSLRRLHISGTGACALAIEDIEITGDGCSAVPIEPETWGWVKTRYRSARE
jgi:hypothetical protein